MDIRSFALNFEVNAVVYGSDKAEEMIDIFNEDLKVSTQITKEIYSERNIIVRIKEQICRLMSPLL
jgi:cardiolipin synthase